MMVAVDHLVNNAGMAHSFFFTDTKDLKALTSTLVRFKARITAAAAVTVKINVV